MMSSSVIFSRPESSGGSLSLSSHTKYVIKEWFLPPHGFVWGQQQHSQLQLWQGGSQGWPPSSSFLLWHHRALATLQLPPWWRSVSSSSLNRPKSSRSDSRYRHICVYVSATVNVGKNVLQKARAWSSVLQESRKKVRHEKKEPLQESQLFIMELARELNKICQVSLPLKTLKYHRE